MSLVSQAQSSDDELLAVFEPTSPASQLNADYHEVHHHHHFPEVHQENETGGHDNIEALTVAEPIEIEIIVDELPGAPAGTVDPEPIEIVEEPLKVDEEKDDNDVKSTKSSKWDWSADGAKGFIAWVKARLAEVPKHSGYDSSGLERAAAYLEKLDNEISKAMRLDLDEELDANKIEEVRNQLDDGLSRLQARLDKVKKAKKSKSRKKRAEEEMTEIVKEGQKIAGVSGVYVMVPLYISSIARTCINGMVSAGKDIEWIYHEQVKKFDLDELQQLELRQLLFDMGLPMRVDMGKKPDEDLIVSDEDNYNWNPNYNA